jgi:hypothetical protein
LSGDPQGPVATPATRSTLVNVIAWFGIATGACATPVAVIQTLMLGTLAPQLQAALESQEMAQMPAPVRLAFENFELVFQVFLAAAVATLVFSIGLLKRKNWGRLGVIALLGVAIVQQLLLFWVQMSMGTALSVPGGEGLPELQAAMLLMQVVGGVLTVVQVGVCAWLIWKLQTPAIRAEFGG